jgi:cell division septation protein DedD
MHALKVVSTVAAAVAGVVGVSVATGVAPQASHAAVTSGYGLLTGAPAAAYASATDTAGIEVGMRFRPAQDGTVLGIRFYKAAGNTGTHIGSLWTASGKELARVTFSGETATGWQEAALATPVAVSAGHTYLVSYLAPHGHYSQTPHYFAHTVVSGALSAPTDNGRYLHGTIAKFPTNTHNGDNYWVDVEFQPAAVPESAPTPAPTTPAPTTPAPTTPAPTTPAPTTTAPTTTALLPSQVLDLANWKLNLPIAAPGTSTSMEIANLIGYTNAPYFATTPDNAAVEFVAPVGGATTSGSSYPRSELREMSGGKGASWSTTVGVHTMVVREATLHLPVVKPQVVTAQIHSASDDVIEILTDGSRSTSKPGTVSICLRYKGSMKTPCLDDAYVLGTPYTITITAGGGHIKIAYNGVQKFDYATSMSGLYFKAGAYTQSNPSKGDAPTAYGETAIYALNVTHS